MRDNVRVQQFGQVVRVFAEGFAQGIPVVAYRAFQMRHLLLARGLFGVRRFAAEQGHRFGGDGRELQRADLAQGLAGKPGVIATRVREILLEAAAPVLKALASDHGYTRLAVFGSLARGQARPDSDIDLIVKAPEGTSTFGFIGFKQLVEQVLDRKVDLIDYCGLKPRVDDDIRREAVLL